MLTFVNRTNLAIILVMMQVSKKIPFDNPDVLLGVRTLYIATNIAIAALYYYIYTIILQKKGASTFCLPYILP